MGDGECGFPKSCVNLTPGGKNWNAISVLVTSDLGWLQRVLLGHIEGAKNSASIVTYFRVLM
jgi:hypothetical protein